MEFSPIVKIDRLDDTFVGKQVTVAGRVFKKRDYGKMAFLFLCDSVPSMHRTLQVVFSHSFLKKAGKDITEIGKLTLDCTLVVYGKFTRVMEGKTSPTGYELFAEDWKVESIIEDPSSHFHEYPDNKLPPTYFEMLRDFEHQPYESQCITKATIYYIRSELEHALHEFFREEMYMYVKTPVITFGDCEGGSAQFRVAPPLSDRVIGLMKDPVFDQFKYFFGAVAALSGSGQLELETLSTDAYCITTAFRAEESDTAKHLAEFTMYEVEKHHSRSSKDVRELAERMLKYCIRYALVHLRYYIEYAHSKLLDVDESFQKLVFESPEQYKQAKESEVKKHMDSLQRYYDEPFHVIRHADAVELMLSQPEGTFNESPGYDQDLSSEHEKFLTQHFKKPVHVIYFPQAIKSFYMPIVQETLEESHGVPHVDCFDTLWPGTGEVVGGSQRISRRKDLEKVAHDRGMAVRPLEPYFISRDHGMADHGGYGVGFDRVGKFILGGLVQFSVRDFTPYTRYRKCGNAFDY